MFKNLIRSIKKGKKVDNGEQLCSTSNDVKFEKLNNDKNSLQLERDNEWDETSGRRTPLLTWSASLDNLVNSCKNEKRTQNRRDDDCFVLGATKDAGNEDDESANNLDLTNLADEYKVGLRFDSPHLCSTGKKSADFKRLVQQNKEMADASQLIYENLVEKYGDHREYDLDHPVPLPRTSKSRESISNRRSFSSTFIVDDQTSPETSCHIGPRRHDKTYFKNRSKDFSQNLDYTSPCFTPESLKCISLTENMSLKAGRSSNDLNNTSKYAFNSTEESFVLSSTIVADSRCLADEKELCRVIDFVEGTPRNHLYKPTHFFDIFSSADTTSHQAWTVVPLKFLHLDCLEPFVLASDEFDQPFIFNVGSHKMLREGDRFLELNGLVVIQMDKRGILALFDTLPLGCTIRAVVLRKVVGLDTNNNLGDK